PCGDQIYADDPGVFSLSLTPELKFAGTPRRRWPDLRVPKDYDPDRKGPPYRPPPSPTDRIITTKVPNLPRKCVNRTRSGEVPPPAARRGPGTVADPAAVPRPDPRARGEARRGSARRPDRPRPRGAGAREPPQGGRPAADRPRDPAGVHLGAGHG